MGLLHGKVERWIPRAAWGQQRPGEDRGPPGVRVDLFGCIDVLALDGQPGVLGIQSCAASGLAAHVAKITRTDVATAALAWIAAGNRLQVWAWAKRGPRGSRKLWGLTIRPITTADFELPG